MASGKSLPGRRRSVLGVSGLRGRRATGWWLRSG